MNTSSEIELASRTIPAAEITQEVRFAVVMYGGVSLCIYINGVAQELLELSRVTTVDPDGHSLHAPAGAGAVYRRIAQYLGSEPLKSALLEKADPAAPIHTRFVVDVLSGTSAGGLNSLFLAKALANDQDMEGLKQLWMEEGEITRLLNDAESVRGEECLDDTSEPTSLLNSQRMYKKLLTALDAMDFPGRRTSAVAGGQDAGVEQPSGLQPSPHVEELDCYITTTDLAGLPVQMKLGNTVATEQRHRNVFHFCYRSHEPRNDFEAKHNPFLAFSGRCTSAFPFAFEPMRLADIDRVLPCWKRYDLQGEEKMALRELWEKRFYHDYTDAGCDFTGRSFGDGGYLDNKPFSYATRTLMRRQATLPVKRKLIYVDPSPEAPRRGSVQEKRPDFIENSTAALVELPRYETIREDIQAVLERNKLLDTVTALTAYVDDDVERRQRERDATRSSEMEESQLPYQSRGLQERMKTEGLGYGTYHRLRVRAVTRNLANLIGRASGFDADSEECQAIRWMVERWLKATFAEEPDEGAVPFGAKEDVVPKSGTRPRSSQNSFLSAFDIDYRLRRIFFIQRRIGDLLRLDPARASEPSDPSRVRMPCPDWLEPIIQDPVALKDFRAELRHIKSGLAEPLGILVGVERTLLEEKEVIGLLSSSLLDDVPAKAESDATKREQVRRILLDVLANPTQATAIYEANEKEFDGIARAIARVFGGQFAVARDSLTKVLPGSALESPLLPRTGISGAEAAHTALQRIGQQFDYYDAVIFPIQYGTDAGEANRVDIVRISPPDAQQLIREGKEKRRKLAGTAVFSFGAFLARFWRENDMLWGRLDAAEVLIRSLLQGTPAEKDQALTNQLVDDAHRAILSETLTLAQRQQLWDFICEALAASSVARARKPPSDNDVRSAVADLLRDLPDLHQRIRTVLRFAGGEDDEALRQYFQDNYEVRRRLVVADQLRLGARAGRIISRMLNVLARDRDITALKKHAALLPRIAAVIWGLVEISIPRTLSWFLWEDWRFRFYTAGVVFLVTGFFWQPAITAAVVVIGGTLAIDAARWWIGDLVRGTGRWKSLLTWLLILLGLIVVILAAWKGVDLWRWARTIAGL